MKKLLALAALVGVVACPTAPPATTSNAAGAPTPTAAVQAFFGAVHAGDLQAMSLVWGTRKGPARETMARDELEKREVILQCYFNHDAFKILSEGTSLEGRRPFLVQLTRGAQQRNTTVTTVRGPSDRWYVESLDIAAVRDFCTPSKP